MKAITDEFRNKLKNIKQINAVISYADRENTNYIVTQNNEILQTEAEDFLITESDEVVIENNGIQNISVYWNTNLLKSCCKMIDLETSNPIPKGTEIYVKVGILIGEEFEYVDYGKFYTTQDSEYQMTTGTYTTIGYDAMVKFNINVKENPLEFEEGVVYTLKQYLDMICDKCGVIKTFTLDSNVNASKSVIDNNPYSNNEKTTYRDILDDIAECLGTNFVINKDNRITNKDFKVSFIQSDVSRVNDIIFGTIEPTEEDYKKYDVNFDGVIDISDRIIIQQIINGQRPPYLIGITLDDDFMKNNNVYVGEKKDGITGIQVYDRDTMLNYTGTDESVYVIKNNNIMNKFSSQLLDNVLPKIEGISYYKYNLETFGILALECFDFFNFEHNNTNYLLLSLHNDIQVSQGLNEEISYDFEREDNTNDYETSTSNSNLKDAFIEIDKANSQIVLKVQEDGSLAEVELGTDAESGSRFNVKADNINLEGYTTINNGFGVDLEGNMFANGGTFGGTINTSQNCTVGNNLYVGQNQSGGDLTGKGIYFNNDTKIDRKTAGGGVIDILSIYSPKAISNVINGNTMINLTDGYVNAYGVFRVILNSENICTFQSNEIQFAFQPRIVSDKRLKKQIKNVDVSWIDELKVKEYEYKNSPGNKQIGLIAQDYENKDYAKYFLGKKDDGYYGIQYGNITNALIQYCQELKKEVSELKKEVKSLKGE